MGCLNRGNEQTAIDKPEISANLVAWQLQLAQQVDCRQRGCRSGFCRRRWASGGAPAPQPMVAQWTRNRRPKANQACPVQALGDMIEVVLIDLEG